MISFESDYIQGAHPAILENLCKTNMQALSGYGEDEYCDSAKKKIAEACGIDTADVQLLVGGTQTNQIVIASMLKLWEGVISANTGHINAHEAGAIEYTGHKVLTLPHYNGKISAEDLANYLRDFYADANHTHAVFPGAGGPVIDWKWYEVMYGERYMGHPDTNPEGYAKTSLINKAKDLKGKLLICQGAIDPVVVWEHSLSFIRECIKNNVQVDYFPYPCAEHNVMGKDRVHLHDKISMYFEDYL